MLGTDATALKAVAARMKTLFSRCVFLKLCLSHQRLASQITLHLVIGVKPADG